MQQFAITLIALPPCGPKVRPSVRGQRQFQQSTLCK
jgi:hypothetical protein